MEEEVTKKKKSPNQKQTRKESKADFLTHSSCHLRVLEKNQLLNDTEEQEELTTKILNIPRSSDFILIPQTKYDDKKICDFFNENFYLPINKLQWQLEKNRFALKKLYGSHNESAIEELEKQANLLKSEVISLEKNFYTTLSTKLLKHFPESVFEIPWLGNTPQTYQMNIFDEKFLYLILEFSYIYDSVDDFTSRFLENIKNYSTPVNRYHLCLSMQDSQGLNQPKGGEYFLFLHYQDSHLSYFSYPTFTYWQGHFIPPNQAHKEFNITELNLNSAIISVDIAERKDTSHFGILPLRINSLNSMAKLSLMRLK